MLTMQSHAEVRAHLAQGAAAVFSGDHAGMARAATWLGSLSARELLRVDGGARSVLHGPSLGLSEQWTDEVLASSGVAGAALGSMQYDGRVRERAFAVLDRSADPLADRMLAVRVTDHVQVIREAATRAVLERVSLDQADGIAPLLHRIWSRWWGADVMPLYLRALTEAHGEDGAWARLRASPDRDVRRTAFRRSLAAGLLDVEAAVRALDRDRDRTVQGLLAKHIADRAAPGEVAANLLRSGVAEARALGLVRLTAAQLDPADVERLLVDRSVLVRLWARRRWQEQGRDAAVVYAAVARGPAPAAVRARAYTGLAEAGATVERDEALGLVRSGQPPLSKSGLRLLAGRATAQDAPLLLNVVASGTARAARMASSILLEIPFAWADDDLRELSVSPDPVLRRRAWWLRRGRGRWDEVVADLEIALDDDPELASLGRSVSVPAYFDPTEAQRARIAELLPRVWPDRWRTSGIAFAAGLSSPR